MARSLLLRRGNRIITMTTTNELGDTCLSYVLYSELDVELDEQSKLDVALDV